MSDDYLWDRSTAAEPDELDEFVAQLERRMAPLRDEGDELIDEVLAASGEPIEHEAVVVTLPSPRPRTAEVVAPVTGGRWIWLSVAAGILLTISTLVLIGDAHRRAEPTMVQIGADVAPTARVHVGVGSLSPSVAESRWAALVELRPLHRQLAECAQARVAEHGDALELELSVALRSGAAITESVHARSGELDDETRACLTQAIDEWQPQALGAGELSVLVTIEAGS